MITSRNVRSYEYKNDFLYIVIRQMPEAGPNAYLYCCGINIFRFDPLCWGKAGICSNPAFKGLQLLRNDVSAYVLKKGLRTKNAAQIPCGPLTPRGDCWYRESALLIEDATPRAIREILAFSVNDLVKTVLDVFAPDAKLPAKLPTPQGMQTYLESMSVQKYTQAAPRPMVKSAK